MSMKKIIIFIVLCVAAVAGYLWHTDFFVSKTGGNYNVLRDLSVAYNADSEIKAARERLATGVEPALIIKQGPSGKKEIAMTFDGLADSATIDGILDVLAKHNAKATFFVEGVNAAAAPKVVTAIVKAGQKVENYSYVGLAHMEKLPEEKTLEEICKTQKVLQITTDFKPKLFKGCDTAYNDTLLRRVKACGLNYVVQTSSFVKANQSENIAGATALVQKLQPGQIVSWRLTIPADIKKERGKTDQRPAIDKQPGLEKIPELGLGQNKIAIAVDSFLTALKQAGYTTVYVEDFTPKAPKNITVALTEVGNWLGRIGNSVKSLFDMPVAYAAAANIAQDNSPITEVKMVYTTEQVVPFTFTGLSKEESVRNVLRVLKENNSTGTFFVTEQEIKRQGGLISEIIAGGNELGIAVRPRASEGLGQIEEALIRTHELLLNNYGVNTTLVKQFSGPVKEETKQAIANKGYTLIGQMINVVQSRHQNAQTADEVMRDIFGSKVYSVGRGWIVQIRMDFYQNQQLAAAMFAAIKRNKIDNIAYVSYQDSPATNRYNDSAYQVVPVGKALSNNKALWNYPVPSRNVLPRLLPTRISNGKGENNFINELRQRYIGFKWVNEDDRMLGFSPVEAEKMDKTGRIHTHDNVVFLTFDDWGTDAAVNKLLYVFRKHNVKGNFFVLTHNVPNNPNLLRALAKEGHNICAHSNMHKAMAVRIDGKGPQVPTQTPEQMVTDANECYTRLLSVTGDVFYNGRPVLTKYYRPPTLAISRDGIKALFGAGYTYIVAGFASTEDYNADSLETMINRIKDAIYLNGKVRKGAILVMHMSDTSHYTALALDAVLTANERRAEGDPAKFRVGKLSDYLVDGYNQSAPFRF